jgi:hypothetical protein
MADKYSSLYKDIYAFFELAGWKAELIKTFPDNFVGSAVGDEYIRVTIIPSQLTGDNRLGSVSGQVIIDIFISAGAGPTRAAIIADKLDKYLAGQSNNSTANGNTQFGISSLSPLGNDRDNPSLYRFHYSIPFNYFGV